MEHNTANPLKLLPAKARATVYIIALVIGVVTPFIIPDLTPAWQHSLQALAAVAALFTASQGLSNLTPDSDNSSIQAKPAE